MQVVFGPVAYVAGLLYIWGMVFQNRIYVQDGEIVKHPSDSIDFHSDYEWTLFICPTPMGGMAVDYIKYTFADDGSDLILYLSSVHPDALKSAPHKLYCNPHQMRVDDFI